MPLPTGVRGYRSHDSPLLKTYKPTIAQFWLGPFTCGWFWTTLLIKVVWGLAWRSNDYRILVTCFGLEHLDKYQSFCLLCSVCRGDRVKHQLIRVSAVINQIDGFCRHIHISSDLSFYLLSSIFLIAFLMRRKRTSFLRKRAAPNKGLPSVEVDKWREGSNLRMPRIHRFYHRRS